MFNHIKKKWKTILPLTIGVFIGWFFAETLFGGFFMILDTVLANGLEVYYFKLVPLKTIRWKNYYSHYWLRLFRVLWIRYSNALNVLLLVLLYKLVLKNFVDLFCGCGKVSLKLPKSCQNTLLKHYFCVWVTTQVL